MAEAFQRALTHVHHRRLDYPGFDFNRQRATGSEKRRGPVALPAPAPPPGVVAPAASDPGDDTAAESAARSTLARQA